MKIDGAVGHSVEGRVLTAQAMDADNTFDQPDRVKPQAFRGAKIEGGELTATLPAKSVVVLDLH